MPDNYYPQMDREKPDAAMATVKTDAEEHPDKEDSATTALIPKSLLAGKEFKVGEEVVLKIVHLYEDEVEVEYAPEKPQTDNEHAAEMSANDEIDQMAASNNSERM